MGQKTDCTRDGLLDPRGMMTIKTHPDLRPYSELPDSEKDYDRLMVAEVLKVLLALGYKINTFWEKGYNEK